jgi:hypothetical protein
MLLNKSNDFHVIFEDDSETGYLYIIDLKNKNSENPIQDAIHIYNVRNMVDKNIPSEIQFSWSKDGYICIFLINNYPHALINYNENYCFCRTGFPPNNKNSIWSKNGHNWNEEIFNKIIENKYVEIKLKSAFEL